ncbi:dihydroneopterin aldolase [Nitratifractor salsuginis]|uniref:Dihydroneopterin aldolase n=1 Tax=Nitratifractor salsuginis (strain DSM 16511 / JCM 12458 / E9I37-1) TaxID=749222 RepID=E6X2E6_NITSE|nr:dihydroneopterin aldolase [Nitratifractor salsuginis]ADV47151.1 dihydroneopterin aldolase [Nitratifractor salsuginis DSM 16511]
MKIEIREFRLEAIIGILPEERHTPQALIVDLEAEYSYAAQGFLDYAQLCELIRHILLEGKFSLLEEALLVLKERIFENYPHIDYLFLRLSKPDILSDCRVAVSESWSSVTSAHSEGSEI